MRVQPGAGFSRHSGRMGDFPRASTILVEREETFVWSEAREAVGGERAIRVNRWLAYTLGTPAIGAFSHS